jgi:hypothetical protein
MNYYNIEDRQMTTRVVHVKEFKPYNKYWTNPPTGKYVYIGRVTWPIRISSKWRNLEPIDRNAPDQAKERQRVLNVHKEHLLNRPELLKQIPIELKDKVLGCWCKPEPCHGDLLAAIADGNYKF